MISDAELNELRATYVEKLSHIGQEEAYKRGYLHGRVDLIDLLLEER